MKPPPRLLDDPALRSDLREDLQRAAATSPAYDAAAGLASLQAAVAALPASGADSAAAAGTHAAAEPMIANGPAASAATTGSASAGASGGALLGSAAGKLALVAAGAGLIAAGVIAWPSSSPERPRTETAAPQAPAGVSGAIDAELARIRKDAERAGDGEAALALRREIDELGRVRALLERNPAEAYELAESGHRRFPSGMLRHEREGLALLALFELGQRTEALVRTRAFLARYPASPLRAELQRRMQRTNAARARETR
jgi:hypothetical protein